MYESPQLPPLTLPNTVPSLPPLTLPSTPFDVNSLSVESVTHTPVINKVLSETDNLVSKERVEHEYVPAHLTHSTETRETLLIENRDGQNLMKKKPKAKLYSFSETDRAIIHLISHHGMLTPRHIALGTGNRNAKHIMPRLKVMEENDLLRTKRLDRGITGYELTQVGLQRGGISTTEIRPWKRQLGWKHHLAEATLGIALTTGEWQNRDGDGFPEPWKLFNQPVPLINELKLSKRQHAMDSSYKSDWHRLMKEAQVEAGEQGLVVPVDGSVTDLMTAASNNRRALETFWGSRAEQFIHWDTQGVFGKRHRPDLIIPMPLVDIPDSDLFAPLHIAVEIELTIKSRAEYKRILRQLIDHPFYKNIFYVVDKQYIENRIRRAHQELIEEGKIKADHGTGLIFKRMHYLNTQADRESFYG